MLTDVFFIFNLKVSLQKTVITPSRFDHAWSSSNLWSQILSSSHRDAYFCIFFLLGGIFYLSGIVASFYGKILWKQESF